MERLTNDEYYELAAFERIPNRAKIYMIMLVDFADYYPGIRELDVLPDNEKLNEIFDDDTKDIWDVGLTILRTKNTDLRRGDVVFIEHEVGYRNSGMGMFDGRKIIALGIDDLIPEEFQIGEFPPFYWTFSINGPVISQSTEGDVFDIFNSLNMVPFNFSERLPKISIANIKIMSRKDQRGIHLVIPFIGLNNKIFAIIDANITLNHDIENRAQIFLNSIRNICYFELYFLDTLPDGSDELSLPEGFSYEELLVFNEKSVNIYSE